jgi:hypothetical protein
VRLEVIIRDDSSLVWGTSRQVVHITPRCNWTLSIDCLSPTSVHQPSPVGATRHLYPGKSPLHISAGTGPVEPGLDVKKGKSGVPKCRLEWGRVSERTGCRKKSGMKAIKAWMLSVIYQHHQRSSLYHPGKLTRLFISLSLRSVYPPTL